MCSIDDFDLTIFDDDTRKIYATKKKKKQKPIKRNKNLTTWVDKYRPKTLNQIIGHEEMKSVLIKSIKRGNLTHLLFHGSSGTGKTSTVHALITQLYGPKKIKENVLELNASDENGIGVVREKIIKFARFEVGTPDPDYASPPFKIIILDEADAMTSEAQTALKKVMETTTKITRFVFICNYENKIIDAIKSRCKTFKFNPLPKNLVIKKLKTIVSDEKMNVDNEVYDIITKICKGDARRSINTLQNLKYIPHKKNNMITKEDIYNITSYVSEKEFAGIWKKCLHMNINELVELSINITNQGYPMLYILNYLSDKTLTSKLNDEQKCKIILFLGKIEKMIADGSDSYIQLLSALSYINGVNRNMKILEN
jgi:replication factor C subunit 2/4